MEYFLKSVRKGHKLKSNGGIDIDEDIYVTLPNLLLACQRAKKRKPPYRKFLQNFPFMHSQGIKDRFT